MKDKGRIISLSAAGLDSHGLVSKITTEIFEMKGNIIDVEESCRRGLFSIFLIIDFSSSEDSLDEITGRLKRIEQETGLKVILGVYDEDEIPRLPGGEHHIVTLLGVDQPGIIARVSSLFRDHRINIENCRVIARGRVFSMEMVVDTAKIIVEPPLSREESIDKMKRALKDLCADLDQSVVIQSEDLYNKVKKLVVFDVESSLVNDSSLTDFLRKVEGKITSVNGKRAFSQDGEDNLQVLIENARKLKGIPLRELKNFSEILQLNPGALELIRILKSMGFKIALLSSGFNFIIKRIFEAAGVDYAFSNTLQVDENGIITGELEEPVITAATKEEILEFIMRVENIAREQVIAVGDGSTGSHFMENVGLSIAFKPDRATIQTHGILSSDNIINMLYCLGIPKAELESQLRKIAPE
jgi:phosphoserine phosphatase